MTYEETKNNISNFMLSNKKFYFFTISDLKKIDLFFHKIFTNIEKCFETKTCKNDVSEKELFGLYEMLKDKLLFESGFDNNFRIFVNSTIELCLNYINHFYYNNESLKNKFKKLNRINQLIFTNYEMILISSKLINNMKKYINYKPPSIELAKHYLKTLEEK